MLQDETPVRGWLVRVQHSGRRGFHTFNFHQGEGLGAFVVIKATVKSLQRSELGPLAALTRFLEPVGAEPLGPSLGCQVPDTLQLAARLCADRNASEAARERCFGP